MNGLLNLTTNMNVGIYCRLSRDDGNLGDSGSIQNQKEFLKEYVEKEGWNLVNIYIDDGYSGTVFDNRPGFQRMLSDIEAKKINCVITKDLSRLGRNYIKSGYYLEEYFPKNNIRYIAVNDNYDNLFESNNDFAPFKNIINEWYARDISKKVKFSIRAMQERGEVRKQGKVLYGYLQDDDGNRTLDPETAPIVQMIFDLYLEIKSIEEVARILKEKKVITPGYHDFIKNGHNAKFYTNISEEEKYSWRATQIRRILRNEQYLGKLIKGQYYNVSFKVKISKKNPNPYVFDDVFPPIITKDQFDAANRLIDAYRSNFAPESENMYQKMVKCECCGKTLTFGVKANQKKENGRYRYYCRNSSCGDHAYISKHMLDEIIKQEINSLIDHILDKKEEFLEFANKYTYNKTVRFETNKKNNEELLITRKKELQKYIQGTFKAKLEGDIDEEMYLNITSGYKEELKQIEIKLASFDKDIQFVDYSSCAMDFIKALERIQDKEVLDVNVIASICNSIHIKSVKENRRAVKFIVRIVYGALDEVIRGFINE